MRSQLRIADLKRGTTGATRTINISISSHITKKLGTSKTAVVLALLNAALNVVGKKRGGQARS
jgi:hypothetical protein